MALEDKLAPAVVWAAGMVSESLGKRLLDWVNPMHETHSLEICAWRANEGHDSRMSQRGARKPAGFFNCRQQFAIDATADLLLLHGFLLGLMIRITLAFLAPFLALQVASSHLGSTSLMFFRNGPGFTSSLVPKPRPKTVQWSLLIAWLYWVRCTGFRVNLGKLWPSCEQRKRTLAWVMRRKRRSSRSIQGQKRKDCQTRRGDMAESWLLHSCLKILSMDDVASESLCWFAGTKQLEFWLVACFGARCALSCFCFHCDNYDLCSLNHLLSSAADSYRYKIYSSMKNV